MSIKGDDSMSFTSEVKNEVSKLDTMNLENVTELSAICRNIAVVNDKSIKITTENASVARRIFNLIKENYLITCKATVRRGYNFNKNYTVFRTVFRATTRQPDPIVPPALQNPRSPLVP